MTSPVVLSQGESLEVVGCVHEWSEEYHTHLGHEQFGAHAAHRTCKLCGWTVSSFSHDSSDLVSPEIQAYWTILPRPHRCRAGWRGVSILEREFGVDLVPLPGRPGKLALGPLEERCPCCRIGTTRGGRLCQGCGGEATGCVHCGTGSAWWVLGICSNCRKPGDPTLERVRRAVHLARWVSGFPCNALEERQRQVEAATREWYAAYGLAVAQERGRGEQT